MLWISTLVDKNKEMESIFARFSKNIAQNLDSSLPYMVHSTTIGLEISLRILVSVAKPAGGIKVRIDLFISFPSSTQLQILENFWIIFLFPAGF